MKNKIIVNRRVEDNIQWDDEIWVKTVGLLENYFYPVSELRKFCHKNDPLNEKFMNSPWSQIHGRYYWASDKKLPNWLRKAMEDFRI